MYITGRCVLSSVSGWVLLRESQRASAHVLERAQLVCRSIHSTLRLLVFLFTLFAAIGFVFVFGLATSICTLPSGFFSFHAHFFFSPARNTEKVGGAALRSVPHSLWLVRTHSHTHSLPFCHCHLGRRETVLFPATLTAGESTALTLLEPGHGKEYNFSSRSRKDPRREEEKRQ